MTRPNHSIPGLSNFAQVKADATVVNGHVVISDTSGDSITLNSVQTVGQLHGYDLDRAFFLSGNCSPDGQQTPFLPFIEVVRGSFRVGAGEAEKGIVQKLEMGLTTLGLHSLRNLGLLLHLLGLKAPEGSLTGLDGVLIGLRTRELLQQLLEARCRLSPVVMMIEDLHWIDSASQELLGRIVESEGSLRLLLVTTRRPDTSRRG
jgi:predicted ATPase